MTTGGRQDPVLSTGWHHGAEMQCLMGSQEPLDPCCQAGTCCPPCPWKWSWYSASINSTCQRGGQQAASLHSRCQKDQNVSVAVPLPIPFFLWEEQFSAQQPYSFHTLALQRQEAWFGRPETSGEEQTLWGTTSCHTYVYKGDWHPRSGRRDVRGVQSLSDPPAWNQGSHSDPAREVTSPWKVICGV